MRESWFYFMMLVLILAFVATYQSLQLGDRSNGFDLFQSRLVPEASR